MTLADTFRVTKDILLVKMLTKAMLNLKKNKTVAIQSKW